jgi:hypothetical protein
MSCAATNAAMVGAAARTSLSAIASRPLLDSASALFQFEVQPGCGSVALGFANGCAAAALSSNRALNAYGKPPVPAARPACGSAVSAPLSRLTPSALARSTKRALRSSAGCVAPYDTACIGSALAPPPLGKNERLEVGAPRRGRGVESLQKLCSKWVISPIATEISTSITYYR